MERATFGRFAGYAFKEIYDVDFQHCEWRARAGRPSITSATPALGNARGRARGAREHGGRGRSRDGCGGARHLMDSRAEDVWNGHLAYVR
eukprot:3604826-Pyramimonas_sp.AAC.1